VSIVVRESKSSKASLGAGEQLRRTIGTVFVDIFSPIGRGSKPTRDLIDSVKAVFRDQQVSGVTFMEASDTIFGERYYTNSGTGTPATAQQYQALVTIPYVYEEYL
jgi:hypothetical protein